MRRHLKIAVSVFFAALTVALCMLWVRSYWWTDNASGCWRQYLIFVRSHTGKIGITSNVPKSFDGVQTRWQFYSDQIGPSDSLSGAIDPFLLRHMHHKPGFDWGKFANGWGLGVSFWLLSMVCGSLSVLPWLTFRFSLRTIFIATTLTAIVLGIIAYATR